MTSFQTYLDTANRALAEFKESAQRYFVGCTQNEWYAWGGNALGLILIITGIVLMILGI